MKCHNFERRQQRKPDDTREGLLKFWRDAALVVARAENTKGADTPGRWANKMLEDYCLLIKGIYGTEEKK